MGAVKNAMQRDGLDPEIMDLDPNKSVASQMKNADDGPPLKEDPKYTKYFKMLKMVSAGDAFVLYQLFYLLAKHASQRCLLWFSRASRWGQ